MEVQGGKFLTFNLDEEDYGLPIQKVKEIIGIMEITHVPKTPDFIKGVVNLRGKIIPIMDLRLKFSLSEIPYNQRTCIIVVELALGETTRLMGIIVDIVSEVLNIQKSEIDPPPQYNAQSQTNFLIGMGKVKNRVIMLLDIEQILNNEELVLLNEIK